tara:strand:- start:8219 stop:8383 length:165 start_codon:yes stop_codon:yes gene_type:complete
MTYYFGDSTYGILCAYCQRDACVGIHVTDEDGEVTSWCSKECKECSEREEGGED